MFLWDFQVFFYHTLITKISELPAQQIVCTKYHTYNKTTTKIRNMWGYGSWNNWEKEEGSTKDIVGGVRKEGFGTIWLQKKRCIQSKVMVRVN